MSARDGGAHWKGKLRMDVDSRPGMAWDVDIVDEDGITVCFMAVPFQATVSDECDRGLARARALVEAANERDALREALRDLHALVWGESPGLLNEDSGGDAPLDLRIRDLLSASPATTTDDAKEVGA